MAREGIMLCYPFEEKRLYKWGAPWYIQRKLDGERCRAICNNQHVQLISSEGHEFKFLPHINEALGRLFLQGVELDGELYNHGIPFNEIHSIVSRKVNPHPEYALVEYHIFDIVNQNPQANRFNELERLWDYIKYKGASEEIKWVPPVMVVNMDQVMHFFDISCEEGYEGFVIRDKSNLYTRKRSTQIMKFKPHKEDVYEVVGTQEEVSIDGKAKNALGAFICRGDDNALFNVGTGPLLTREGREALWEARESLPGQYLKVKYQNITSGKGKGVPRFPVAISVMNLT